MKAEVINQFPIFADLPSSEINSLVETLQECDFHAGEIVLTEGTSMKYFYVVLDGEVEIVKALGTADERVIAQSGKGAILGEMSIFSQEGTHTASVRACTPLKLLMITHDQFDDMLHSCPELALDLVRLYSRRLVESERLTIRELREKNRRLTLAYQELQAAEADVIEKKKLEHELQIASEIQRGILPEVLPSYPTLDFGALMIPARQVGGDFYDFILLDDYRVGIVVGDVCDKGMPAALFMALTYSAVRSEAFRHNSPGATLKAVNQHLLHINRTNMYATLLFGILDWRTCEFSYARAGHPEPLVLDRRSNPVRVPLDEGQPIGLFDTPAIDEQCISIPPGGILLAYSDGLSEAVDDSNHFPALPQLCSTIMKGQSLSAQALCDHLWRAVRDASDESLIKDDFTVVALKNLSPDRDQCSRSFPFQRS
jgi:serine phosphatase RsbU (regulator of sigma subunit)